MFQRTQKIRVLIVGGLIPIKRNLRIEGDTVIVTEAKKGRGGAQVTASFDNTCFVPYYAGLRRSIRFMLILREGSPRCQSFAKDAMSKPDSLTFQDVQRYATATAIKLAGNPEQKGNTLLYALVLINIVITIVAVAVASGNLRIG